MGKRKNVILAANLLISILVVFVGTGFKKQLVDKEELFLIGDGITDNYPIISNVINNKASNRIKLYFPKGVYKISRDITIPENVELSFEKDASLILGSSIKLTIYSNLETYLNQIFTGTGTVLIKNGQGVYPEWWGAKGNGIHDDRNAIQSAINSLDNAGVVILQARKYIISDFLIIQKSNISLVGQGKDITKIIVSSNKNDGIRLIGNERSPISMCNIKDLGITRNTVPAIGGTGISLTYTAVTQLENIHINNFAQGFYMDNANNTLLNKNLVTFNSGKLDAIGFIARNSNVSSVWTDCWVDMSGCTGKTIGFKCDGNHVNDYIFNSPQVASCKYGMVLDASKATWACDIEIFNPIIDDFWYQGIFLHNFLDNSGVIIHGGWLNPHKEGKGEETDSIYLDNCSDVGINQVQFMALANFNKAKGIKAVNNCSRISIGECQFTNQNIGVDMIKSSSSIINGNRFYCKKEQIGYMSIYFQDSVGNIITNNVITGFANYGIYYDTNVCKSISSNNIIDRKGVVNSLVDNGVDNVGSNNIIS